MTCLAGDQLGKDIVDKVGESETYLFDHIFNDEYEDICEKEIVTDFNDNEFDQLFNKYVVDIKKIIDSVIHNENAKKIKGNFIVCGYDPMNMVRYENMVLHKRFLFINDGNEMKFIEGPVVTISKDDNYGETDELIFFIN